MLTPNVTCCASGTCHPAKTCAPNTIPVTRVEARAIVRPDQVPQRSQERRT